MKVYLEERQQRQKRATVIGVILTVAVHLCAVLLVSFTGLKYIYPPPQESTFLLDFEEIEEQPEIIPARGSEARTEEPDLSKPVELVQQSRSPYESTAPNLTPETKADDFGDVPTQAPEPKEEPKLDPRAAFPGMAKKDTSLTAPHSAKEESTGFKAGQADGNTISGKTDGRPNAHLEGRAVNKASLRRPTYTVQESGTVVVRIWVDQYGMVQKAIPGYTGTTVDNKTLWNEARKAAMEAKFEQKADAPALQEGSITYIFNLK